MAKGLIDLLLDEIFDADWVGRRGEKLTERELKLVRLFGRDGEILRNVYIPKDNGETSEIDVLYITQKGIFVFESKNYSGWVFGDERSNYWTVMLPNKEKNRLYNPIKQNRTHIKWLDHYLGGNIPLFSIIVFSERCELKKVTVESADIYVIKRDRTYATVREIWDNAPDNMTDEQISAIYEKLEPLTDVDEAVKQAHIEDINQKYKSGVKKKVIPEGTTNIQEASSTVSTPICPKCGAKLVLRTAKKGANIGNQFYGCSNFPKCRYIQNLDE
jgi:predicted RNA-binding Zn-ribbon protein involved in translation (DUF1610 family)